MPLVLSLFVRSTILSTGSMQQQCVDLGLASGCGTAPPPPPSRISCLSFISYFFLFFRELP